MKLQVKTGVLLIITLEVICVTSWKSSYILPEILNETVWNSNVIHKSFIQHPGILYGHIKRILIFLTTWNTTTKHLVHIYNLGRGSKKSLKKKKSVYTGGHFFWPSYGKIWSFSHDPCGEPREPWENVQKAYEVLRECKLLTRVQ